MNLYGKMCNNSKATIIVIINEEGVPHPLFHTPSTSENAASYSQVFLS